MSRTSIDVPLKCPRRKERDPPTLFGVSEYPEPLILPRQPEQLSVLQGPRRGRFELGGEGGRGGGEEVGRVGGTMAILKGWWTMAFLINNLAASRLYVDSWENAEVPEEN